MGVGQTERRRRREESHRSPGGHDVAIAVVWAILYHACEFLHKNGGN